MKDHLDKKTAVSAELTDKGVKVEANSRIVAAFDRLGGNLFELINAPMETRINRRRLMNDAEMALVEASVQTAVQQIEGDTDYARRILDQGFKGFARKRQNMDGVLIEAKEQLRLGPPDADTSEKPIDEEFLDSFEGYAEKASTERLRQKWGKVLSAEIRAPGTVTRRALRVVDELDADTALLFEELCKSSFDGCIPICIVGRQLFEARKQLVDAGLIMDPGASGHVKFFGQGTDPKRGAVWLLDSKSGATIGFTPDSSWRSGLNQPPDNPVLIDHEGKPGLAIYLLTEAGDAIAKIFPSQDAFLSYVERLRGVMPSDILVDYISTGKSFRKKD